MTVEVDRDALLAAVRRVGDVVEARTTIPVLSNLLVDAADGRLNLTGTDLDLHATATVEAAGSLRTTVDKAKLLAAVSSFKPGRVTITPVDGRSAVQLKSGRGTRILSTLPATDFPCREPLSNAVAFEITGGVLLRLLDTTSIAHSTDPARYYLNGAYLHVLDDQLCAVATDGHKAVVCRTTLPEGAAGMPGIIIPTKSVTLLRKLLAKVEGPVRFETTTVAYQCRIGSTAVIGKLVDGTFPDYQRVIPARADRAIIGVRDAFMEPIAAVAAVVNAEGDQKVRTVVIDAPGGDGECEVSAKDMTGASATEPLDVETEGAAIRFAVNHRYLTAVLGIFAEGSRIDLSLPDPAAPMRLTGDRDADLVTVIMPMRA